ncbi:MDR family MFS transporter [Streptomyces sp. NPDC048603]|uniref:MDR family MFS transporter n=1 Tax=Streptomyces sp. NPDC048603 TaxID=3365577 RepID=UPI0037224DAD
MEQLITEDPAHIGPYRLIARLGAGGMGLVYLGRSEGGRTVAVKVVQAEHAENPEFRRRFAREVAAARRVGGSWTAAVLDADPEAAVPWVATQYIPGPDLHAVVARDFGPLSEHSVRVLTNRLALALQAVHEAGLIHRDLKPSNVLVTVDGPRVIDFGIARAMDSLGPDSLHTHTGMLIGSPGFMSPEQVRGLELTPASDVFCLGAVLVYAATGRMLFGARDTGLNAHLFRVAEEEADLTGVPESLVGLVRACLAKDPAARPTPEQVAERTAEDHAADGDGEWLPGPVLAQLGRHAARLLDFAPEARAGTPDPGPAAAPADARAEASAAGPDPRVPARPAPRSGPSSAPTPPVAPPPPAYAPTTPAHSGAEQGFGPPPVTVPDRLPPHPRRWWGLAVVALAQLMVLLDATTFNIALPVLQADLQIPSDDLDPVFRAYTLGFAALLVLGGHLADLAGRKALLITGLAGSGVASVVAGTAGDYEVLMWARAGQGAFAALVTASALALVTASFTGAKERGRAFGVYAAVVGGGAALGHFTGGWLLESLSWRASAYVSAALAMIALIGTLTLVHDAAGRMGARFDVAGAVLGTAGLVVLTFGFIASQPDNWASVASTSRVVAGATLLAVHLVWRARSSSPFPGPDGVPVRARLGSFLAVLLAGAGTFGAVPPVAYFLAAALDYGPAEAGAALLPMAAAVAIGSTQISARLLPRLGPRLLSAAGLATAALGLLLLAGMDVGGAYAVEVLPGMLLTGLGIGVALTPLFATGTSGIAPQGSGAGAAAVTAAQYAGATLGAAVFSSVLTARLRDWNPQSPGASLLAGYIDTLWWSAGSVLLAALAAGLLINTKAPARTAPQPGRR